MTGIVIADDHAAFAGALAAVLEDRGMTVLAVEHTLADTVAGIETYRPELCVLGRWFDDGDALGILPDLRAASPDTRIVVVSADLDRRIPRAVIDAGAHGFVHKTRGVAALLDALAHTDGVVVIEIPPRWAGRKERAAQNVRARRGLAAAPHVVRPRIGTDAAARRP